MGGSGLKGGALWSLAREDSARLTPFPLAYLTGFRKLIQPGPDFQKASPVQTSKTFKPRVFSGIQPSGGLTLGNYLGALKRFVEKQDEGIETIYCMVDMHAITVWQDPVKLRQQTREGAAAFIAAGIDPKRSILFNQSQVSAHAELGWIFNCVARMGWMGRMTQWKDKTAGKNAEAASLGLFAYPSLMAADILLYHATMVPVGDDQKQHVELTRDIAQKFNHDYRVDFFPIVEPRDRRPRRRASCTCATAPRRCRNRTPAITAAST